MGDVRTAIGARRRRADAGHPRVSDRDVALLRWVGEQYAVSLPQLARLMGRSGHAARWLRGRWQRAGWAAGGALVVGQPVFVWLTRAGAELCGSPFKVWQPIPGRWHTSPRSTRCGCRLRRAGRGRCG